MSAVPAEVLRQIEQAITSLRYGTVQVTVHDAQVVQIDRVERMRVAPTVHLTTGHSSPRPPQGRGSPTQTSPTDRTSGGSRQQAGQ